MKFDPRMDAIDQVWREHESAPFPDGQAGIEVSGIDLVLLDADIAGCVATFLRSGGRLDWDRVEILRRCHGEVRVVVRELTGAAQIYFARLERVCGAVLEAVAQPRGGNRTG